MSAVDDSVEEISDPEYSDESVITFIGDPADQNRVFLDKGDVVRYRNHDKELEAFFVASKPGSEYVKIRKTEDYYEYISVTRIVEKVEDPEISEGYRREEGYIEKSVDTSSINFEALVENWSKSFHGSLPDTLKEFLFKTKVPLDALLECPGCGSSWEDEFCIEVQDLVSVRWSCRSCNRMGELLDDGSVRLESGAPLEEEVRTGVGN